MLRVVYLGTSGPLSVGPLAVLLAAGLRPCAVVAPRPRPEQRLHPGLERLHPVQRGTGLPIAEPSAFPSVASTAWQHGLDLYQVGRCSSSAALEGLRALQPDVLCVSCFPQILSKAALEVPGLGCLNVHPSLLPAYRGPAPLFWTFRDGTGTGGVTVHRMEVRIDSGPIVAQQALQLPDGVSGAWLEQACGRLGGQLLLQALADLGAGRMHAVPQDASEATVQGFPDAADYRISTDWPARRAFNFVRGVATPGRPVEVRTAAGPVALTGATGFAADAVLRSPFERRPGRLAIAFTPGILYASTE
jgi:methionyl-tRNA formyltransferase